MFQIEYRSRIYRNPTIHRRVRLILQLLLVLHAHVALEVQLGRQEQVAVAVLAEERAAFGVRHLQMALQVRLLGKPARTLVARVGQEAHLERWIWTVFQIDLYIKILSEKPSVERRKAGTIG